ncbi:MAG: hypothetical protein Q4C49_04710 [Bacillota bacterium]|nr:hypothetical protein [Bacillota bacterium]
MFTKKRVNAEFGFGKMGDDLIIAGVQEFDYEDNQLLKKLSFPVYENEETKEVLYVYKDKLLTFKELRKVYLQEYYGIA